ncbi:MAG: cytochrome c oxidase subunit [Chloroflexota bacterium]|nr:cytochrome c oxidase subunit [Chloroflexota bacterium]
MLSSLEPIVVLSLVVGAVAAVILAGVLIALVVFTVRYRDPRPGLAPQIHGHRTLELAWTIAPLALLAIVFALSLVTLGQIGRGATFGSLEPPLRISVIGHQWWFEFRYPGGAVTANEAHIPAGVPIELELSSPDVIHDLWVPELGAKSDVVPGQTNVLRLFTARAGTFSGACAEFCGLEHAWMRVVVVAEPRADFDRWLTAQAAPPAVTAGPGADVFRGNVCVACHVIAGVGGTAVGPDLSHVGARRTLAGGVLANTADALRAWIADPQRYKPGALMPKVPLSDADLAALVAYLGSLK